MDRPRIGRTITLPLYKGERDKCNSYRGRKLLSVAGKVYRRAFNERMMKINDMNAGVSEGDLGERRVEKSRSSHGK